MASNNMHEIDVLARKTSELSEEAGKISTKLYDIITRQALEVQTSDHFISLLTVFVLSCIVGYYVVWRVTPALHTPLMAVTNAISGIIIIGAMVVTGFEDLGAATVFGFLGIFLASINIFGGFVVTRRMLKMFDKR
jgi:NAD(P) transhydrogenase subunit alpha